MVTSRVGRQTPTKSKAQIKKQRLLNTAIVLTIAAFVLGGSYWVYLWSKARPAVAAFEKLRNRMSTSASVDGRLQFSGQDFLSNYNTDLNFAGQYDLPNKKMNLTFNGKFAGKNYTGSSEVANDKLYFNVAGPDLPVIRYKQLEFLYGIKSGWYVNRMDRSFFDYYCETRSDDRFPKANFAQRLFETIKLQNYQVVEKTVTNDDMPALHVRADVDSLSLTRAIDLFNAEAPAGCSIKAPQLAVWIQHVVFDLWTSGETDQMWIHFSDPVSGALFDLRATVQNYGKPVIVVEPTEVKDLNAIFLGH